MKQLGQIIAPLRSASSVDEASQALPQVFAPETRTLAARGVARAPDLLDKEADFDIPRRVWDNFIPEHGVRAIVRPLDQHEGAVLRMRASDLHDALLPFGELDNDRVVAAIASMFGGFRSMRQQDGDAVALVDGTRRALSPFPAWAIDKGCLLIQQGQTDLDRRFAPNDSEIFKVIDDLLKPYRRALASATALLRAPVAEPVKRALPSEPRTSPPPQEPMDGKHALRVAADLAERKAMKEAHP